MLANLNQRAVFAKIALAPVGVAALLYWASQHGTVTLNAELSLLLIGATLTLLSVFPFSLRLREVLKLIDYQISELEIVRIQTQSMFYYFFVPLSVGTEVSKFAKLKNLRPGVGSKQIASTILLDHFVGLVVLILLSIGLFLAIDPVVVQFNQTTIYWLFGGGALAGIFGWMYLRTKNPFIVKSILAAIGGNKRKLALAGSYSLIMHLLIAGAVTAGAINWHIDISYLEVLFVLTGAFLFQMIPISLIGVGAIEIAGTGLYLAIGLTISEAVSLVSLLYCYRILIALVGGVWEFVDAWKVRQQRAH